MRFLLQHLRKANVQQLHDLCIIGYIGDEETNFLCEVLQTATNITRLHLNMKHTRSCCARELSLQMNHCTKLSSLRLSYSGTPECVQTFFSSLSPSASELFLLLWELDSRSIQALGNGLQHLHINHLSLRVTNSDINEDGMTFLVNGLQNIKSLDFDLSRNNIDGSGITSSVERLNNLQLIILNLSHSNIGPDGATALAGGIKGLAELIKLDLSHNNIGPDGATALAGGLQYLTELTRCNLSHNNIDVAAAKAVLISLKKCDQLVRLAIIESDDWSNVGIVILGLVSPDDTATISELVEAAQHENKTRTLKLGFKTIEVPPKTEVPPEIIIRLPKKLKCVTL